MSALLDSLKAGFDALPAAPDAATRRAAMAAAITDDLPHARSERWKYTSLRALGARKFALAKPTALADGALLERIPAPRAVFINGHFDAELSQLDVLATGIFLQPLSRSTGRAAAPLNRYEHSDEVFAKLNQALADDGVLLQVDADVRSETAVHLVFISTAGESSDVASHLRHRIALGAGARLTVIEHHLANSAHRGLHNHLCEILLADGAQLRHARVQDDALGASLIARTEAVLARDTEYRRVDLELGAALSRHELNVLLQGDGARLVSGGALLVDGRRHVDTRLGIVHRGRDTACDLRWRGLANDRSRAVFHGGILIEAGADGSDASLSNKNLLLSEHAEIDSQPVLEIHADEVKAAHGATIGRLDETALFYLRSRGIGQAQARQLLIDAFLREPLALLDQPEWAQALGERLSQRIATGDD